MEMPNKPYPDIIGVVAFKDGTMDVYKDCVGVPPSEDYYHSSVVEALQKENEENCRLLGMSAEREIQLLQKVQQLDDQVSCLMQNSESQTQTQMALIKKLAKTEWRPIESAPHGIWVLIFAYGNVCQACWNSNGYWSTFRENRIQPIAATHWMPLPEPPTTEETK